MFRVHEAVVYLVSSLMHPPSDQLFSEEGINGVKPKGVISPHEATPKMQDV